MYPNSILHGFDKRLIIKLGFVFIFLFLLQSILGYVFLNYISTRQALADTSSIIEKVRAGISISGNTWNMARYNADPDLPYPTAPGSFPLYIVTVDGFVVERSRPINGLLDTSDYQRFKNLQKPKTIRGITQEAWRMVSLPIIRNNIAYGTVTVASYNPSVEQLSVIDKILQENVDTILSRIEVVNNALDLRRLDINNIHYNVAFEITNKFNKVLLNNGRLPSYLDPSYVEKEMQSKRERMVKDSITGEKYLVVSEPMRNTQGDIVGLMSVGQPMSIVEAILNAYVLFFLTVSALICLPIIGVISFLIQLEWNRQSQIAQSGEYLPKKIVFDKKIPAIVLDGNPIAIPYASLQYSLLCALLSAPQKKWEYDELLEKMGENNSLENRKIYDAMLAINKRLLCKFIIYQEKVYQINSELSGRISRK